MTTGTGNPVPRAELAPSAGQPSHLALSSGDVAAFHDEGDNFTIADVREPPLARIARHRHDRPSILVVTHGSLTVDEDEGTILLGPTAIAVRPAGARHAHEAGPEGARYVLAEYGDALRAQLGRAAAALATARTFKGRSSVELAWRVGAELRASDPFTPLALRFFAVGIAVGCARYAWHKEQPRSGVAPHVATARRILDQRLGEPPSLGELARAVGCTPAHLARAFRGNVGCTVGEYVRRRRVDRARRLLVRSAMSVGAIAADLGFHDASHFARHFRRATNVSPAQFRAAHRPIISVPTKRPAYRA